MQPTDGAFRHPTGNAQAAAVLLPSLGQTWLDAFLSQPLSMRLGVIRSVTKDSLGFLPRRLRIAVFGRNIIDQGIQLRHIMAVGRRQFHAQGNTVRIGQDMVLTPQFPSIRRVWAGLSPSARTLPLSTAALEKSIL